MIIRIVQRGQKSDDKKMECRVGCGACCIAISISSPLPGMPEGKPAGVRCPHLNNDNSCSIHSTKDYPNVCREFSASRDICGLTNQEAMDNLERLEELTKSN